MFEYQAQVDRVVDGDTIDFVIDLGFDLRRTTRVRLLDVDTAESYGVDHDSAEYELGSEQTEFVEQWLDDVGNETWPFIVTTERTGKYGRYLGRVTRKRDGAVLNDAIVEAYESAASSSDS